jgi:hypothetical protein
MVVEEEDDVVGCGCGGRRGGGGGGGGDDDGGGEEEEEERRGSKEGMYDADCLCFSGAGVRWVKYCWCWVEVGRCVEEWMIVIGWRKDDTTSGPVAVLVDWIGLGGGVVVDLWWILWWIALLEMTAPG